MEFILMVMNNNISRRSFLIGAGAMAFLPSLRGEAQDWFIESSPIARSCDAMMKLMYRWDDAAKLVSKDDYLAYLLDGNTRGFVALENLELSFKKILSAIKKTVVTGDTPAIWSVYNMGYIVKTRRALFSIDLVHRRDAELVDMLDFALVTHNHGDHWRKGFYEAMDKRGKIVISNFLKNAIAAKKNGRRGLSKGKKIFKIKDVEIRTSLTNHNTTLLDYVTTFEIRSGKWTCFHTGDTGKSGEDKLETAWGRPDLWLLFPGCGLNVAKAVSKIKPKRIVFGHAWELGHAKGRAVSKHFIAGFKAAKPHCDDVSLAFWGDRIV
jgi:hypothetical protein